MRKLAILFVLCAVALCAGIFITLPHADFSIGSFSIDLPMEAEVPSPIVYDSATFVGDIMLARNVEYLMNIYGPQYPLALLPQHDATSFLIGNFEGSIPVDHVPTQSMKFSFSIKPEHLAGLTAYGFTHFGLANNHAYDFGVDDFAHTVEVLEAEGFDVFGDPGALATSSIATMQIGSTTIAMVAAYAVYEAPTQAQINQVLVHASGISDVQIVYVHWGEEYAPTHNSFQENLAHAFIDAGADAVIGHHPHVVQDIEVYKNAPVFYSLGNFVFDQYFSEEVQTGLMTKITFAPAGLQFELIPVSSIGSRSAPRLMPSYERDVFLEDLAEKSDTQLAEMILSGIVEIER